MYEAGATLQQIAERYGLGRLRIGELFKEAGFEIRRRGTPPQGHTVKEMYAFYEAGATLEAVAYKFSITPRRLGELFRRDGFVVRRRGTRLTEYPVKEMYEVYQRGASLKEVATRFGVSPSLVGQLFKREGLAVRPRQRAVLSAEYPVAEMHALYQSGASFREVGERYGLNALNVSELFSRAGLPKRSDSKPALSDAEIEARKGQANPRVLAMYQSYERGATLVEIGDDFGITRERVRQLFKKAGLQTRTVSAAAALKQAANLQRADEIVERFRDLKDSVAVASELDIPKNIVTSVLRERLSPGEYRGLTASTKVGSAKRFTDRELIEFLIEANRELGGTLTGTAFNVLARSRHTADGRAWPSKQTYFLRFGSWRKALITAQLDANPSSAVAGRGRYGPQRCAAALREAHLSLGKVPTRADYERWYSNGQEGRQPSPSTVIKRCGTWRDALRLAELIA